MVTTSLGASGCRARAASARGRSRFWTAYRSLEWAERLVRLGREVPAPIEEMRGSDPPVLGIARASGQVKLEISGTAGTGDSTCPKTPVVAVVDYEICSSASNAGRARE